MRCNFNEEEKPLHDILECMNRIETYTEGVDYDSFVVIRC